MSKTTPVRWWRDPCYNRRAMSDRCHLVSSAAMMFSTWAGAEVQHANGCDGRCEVQRRLDAQAKLRAQSMAFALGHDEEDEDE